MSALNQILKKVACFPTHGKQKNYSIDDAAVVQKRTLKYLIRRARFTAFGEHYQFPRMLDADDPVNQFKRIVPIHTYRDMYVRWWYRLLNGESYVTWPGKQKYFITKGFETEDAKKAIPVSRLIINSYCHAGKRFLSLFPVAEENETGLRKPDLNFNKVYYGGTLAAIIAHHKPVKYHCCFRSLFNFNDFKAEPGFLLTEVGWIGMKTNDSDRGYKLIVDNGLYYEFIPFEKEVLQRKNLPREKERTLSLNQVENSKDYIVILTNNSGAWRYFTCYVIRFEEKEKLLFTVTQKVKIS